VQRRLGTILELFRPRRYRLNAHGTERAHVQTERQAADAASAEQKATQNKRKPKNRKAAAADRPAELSQEPSPAYPTTVWISLEDGTRAPGFLEDRAAAYLPGQNLLQINRDFAVYAETIAYCSRGVTADAAVQMIVQDRVYSWYEQALVESVLGILALRHSKEWSDRDIEKALSPEALTAAVMQRYHIIAATCRSLRRTKRLPATNNRATPRRIQDPNLAGNCMTPLA
jgi:hypothetical protein